MSSNPSGDTFDLHRDLPTSVEDVRVLAQLRAASPSWLTLGRLPIDDSTSLQALRARPTTREGHPPFELPKP